MACTWSMRLDKVVPKTRTEWERVSLDQRSPKPPPQPRHESNKRLVKSNINTNPRAKRVITESHVLNNYQIQNAPKPRTEWERAPLGQRSPLSQPQPWHALPHWHCCRAWTGTPWALRGQSLLHFCWCPAGVPSPEFSVCMYVRVCVCLCILWD